jgi:hypothetical protein
MTESGYNREEKFGCANRDCSSRLSAAGKLAGAIAAAFLVHYAQHSAIIFLIGVDPTSRGQ